VAAEVGGGGSSEAILGYELINEPFAGDVIRRPELLLPGLADATLLAPLYESLHAAVRSVDAHTPVLFAGTTWDDAGVGFDAAPGSHAAGDNAGGSVLAYHFYKQVNLSRDLIMKVRPAAADRSARPPACPAARPPGRPDFARLAATGRAAARCCARAVALLLCAAKLQRGCSAALCGQAAARLLCCSVRPSCSAVALLLCAA
jgi:hypothetical protein